MDLEPLTKTMLQNWEKTKLNTIIITDYVTTIYNCVKKLADAKVDYDDSEFKYSTPTCFRYWIDDLYYTNNDCIAVIIEQLKRVFPDCIINLEQIDEMFVICVDWT